MKIYHNSQCSKSNAALSLLQQKGIEPQVVEYLHQVPTKEELSSLLKLLQINPIQLIRTKEPIFIEKFEGKSFTDEQWIAIMTEHPELIERPIIVHNGKAIIARPPERVFELFQDMDSNL